MARFTTAGGEGSGAPGPQGPQGPAGQDANTGDFTFENSSATAPGDITIRSSTAPGTVTLSAYAGVEVETHADFGLTTRKLITTNNGATDNIAIGDDAYLGDGNIANHIVIVGQQDALEGGIVLGERLTETVSSNGTDLTLAADNDIILNPGSNYAYIGTPQIDGSNRIAKMSDITGGGADTGDFVFTAGTATVNANETLNITANDSDEVRSQLVLDPGNGIAKLEAYTNQNSNTFYASNPDWDSSTWVSDGGNGSVITFVNAPNIINFMSTQFNVLNNVKISVNGGTAGVWNGGSYGQSDITMYINGILPPEDTTIVDFSFLYNEVSLIEINQDNGEINISTQSGNDIHISAGDDLYVTAREDDLFLRANDDIRFIARYSDPDLSEQQWTMNSEGELHFPGSGYISNPVSSSGDGFGNDTIELIPDQNLSVDQRIIIDPTAPNHIHIRAGGAQDESQAYLILGGERTHVQVSDQDGNVRISSKQPDITYSLQNVNPESSNLLIVDAEFEIDGNWFIQYNGTKYSLNGYYTQNGQTFMTQYDIPFETGGYYNFGYTRGENEWNFSSDGSLYGPGESSVVKLTGIENATDSNSLSVTSSGTMTVTAAGGDMNFYMDGGMYIGDSDSNNQIMKRSDLNTVESKTLPTGGTTGQVLSKVDDTDYNAEWIDAAAGSVTLTGIETLTNKTLTSPKINEDVEVTATATELNILDGATLSTTELNYVDGVTSAIQTQLDAKLATATASSTYAPKASPTFTGTVTLPSTINGTNSSTSMNLFPTTSAANVTIADAITNGTLGFATGSAFNGTINVATGGITSGSKTINIGTGQGAGGGTYITMGSTNGTSSISLLGSVYANSIAGTTNTSSVNLFNGTTSGNITIGNALTSSSVALANGTNFAGSINIASGATVSGSKTINIGVNGQGGSTTSINIGSATGATSNTYLNGKVIVQNPTVPGSATATGTAGQIAWDENYVYVCTATNTWKRTAISTW